MCEPGPFGLREGISYRVPGFEFPGQGGLTSGTRRFLLRRARFGHRTLILLVQRFELRFQFKPFADEFVLLAAPCCGLLEFDASDAIDEFVLLVAGIVGTSGEGSGFLLALRGLASQLLGRGKPCIGRVLLIQLGAQFGELSHHDILIRSSQGDLQGLLKPVGHAGTIARSPGLGGQGLAGAQRGSGPFVCGPGVGTLPPGTRHQGVLLSVIGCGIRLGHQVLGLCDQCIGHGSVLLGYPVCSGRTLVHGGGILRQCRGLLPCHAERIGLGYIAGKACPRQGIVRR